MLRAKSASVLAASLLPLLGAATLGAAPPTPDPSPGAPARRLMAVTIDDLPAPVSGVPDNSPAALRALTERLLASLARHAVPAVGFVNEGKLFLEGEAAAAAAQRTDLLRVWLDAGLELGNHTYSHRSLNRLPLEEFETDVLRGEAVTRPLMRERGRELRYFRHPFLQVGLELDKRRAFEDFLKRHAYTVAPVTIDDDDYVFAAVYADALRRGDAETARRVAEAYPIYMESVFAFVEGVSRGLFGREIPQVLLIHTNALNADHFEAVARIAERRGYAFVPLAAALADPAYATPDDYVGAWGISWLHHFEITAGRRRSPSPDPPAWVQQAYDRLTRPGGS
ncbi:MAG: polysaccharide deacetylase family protein [Vicinamibacteria bacterium]